VPSAIWTVYALPPALLIAFFTLSMLSEQGAISAQKHILNGNKDGEPGFNMWDSNSVEKI